MIKINISKAKEITHSVRRDARAKEFQPLDIQATIPSMAVEAEVKRQVIREKYAELQIQIDNAQNADELKAIHSEIVGNNA